MSIEDGCMEAYNNSKITCKYGEGVSMDNLKIKEHLLTLTTVAQTKSANKEIFLFIQTLFLFYI